MIAFLSLTTLLLATIFAVAVGSALQWLFLRLSLELIRPATARSTSHTPALSVDTARLIRAYSPRPHGL